MPVADYGRRCCRSATGAVTAFGNKSEGRCGACPTRRAVRHLVGNRQVHQRGRGWEVVPPWLPRRNRWPRSAHQPHHIFGAGPPCVSPSIDPFDVFQPGAPPLVSSLGNLRQLLLESRLYPDMFPLKRQCRSLLISPRKGWLALQALKHP